MSTLTNRTTVGGPMGGATGASAGGGGASTDDSSDSNVLSQYKVLTLTFNQDCTYVLCPDLPLASIASL